MITALLLLVCLVLAGVVTALGVALRRVVARLEALENRPLVVKHVAHDGVETRVDAPSSSDEEHEFVITRLGTEPAEEPAPMLETKLFADVVLRETVVKAASLAYGVRRGLSPANRNRIWFEMRREVKRARKDRKAEEREAIREWRARQRATQGGRHAQREDDAA